MNLNRFMRVAQFLMLSVFSFVSFHSLAQNYSSVDPIEIRGNNDTWDYQQYLNKGNRSKLSPGNTYWINDYFTHGVQNTENTYIWCGVSNAPVQLPAKLWNETAIHDKIALIKILLQFQNLDESLIDSIYLLVSDNNDFESNYIDKIILDPALYKNASQKEFDFIIPNPSIDLFYCLCIDLNPNSPISNFVGLYHMKLYKALPDPEMPVISTVQNSDGSESYAISPVNGELHILASEHDKNDKFVKNILPEGGESSVFDNAVEKWTNKIELAEGQSLVINAPENSDNYIKLRAKTVSGDYHSEELITSVSNRGIATKSPSIENELPSSESEVWYNLQGVRVDNPSKGIYIKIANGKASKISL